MDRKDVLSPEQKKNHQHTVKEHEKHSNGQNKAKSFSASSSTERVAVSAVLIALAMIFSYIEALIPFNFGVPGIKLGLSNLVVLVALYRLGTGYALTINMVRILLSGLLFGGVSGMIYSFAGGITSFIVMWGLKKTGLFSPVGISLAGGVVHNVGQLCIAALVTQTVKIFLYMPILLISGMITGTLLGFAAVLIIKRFKDSNRYFISR